MRNLAIPLEFYQTQTFPAFTNYSSSRLGSQNSATENQTSTVKHKMKITSNNNLEEQQWETITDNNAFT